MPPFSKLPHHARTLSIDRYNVPQLLCMVDIHWHQILNQQLDNANHEFATFTSRLPRSPIKIRLRKLYKCRAHVSMRSVHELSRSTQNPKVSQIKTIQTSKKGGKKSLGKEVHPLSPGGKDQDSFEKGGGTRLRTCVYEDVDEEVLKWIHTMRDKNVPISGLFVIERALLFAKALGYDQLLISNGWLEKFKKRHGIVAKVLSGENNSPAHPKEINLKLKNVTVVYLPPSTTSKLQPADQAVIKDFKVHYRMRILLNVITALENKTCS
ncbi:tigger transposable element-derived protein 4 [Trichonephila clavipes]|nr:tigger transposable element-derived protein 4 [Trichonephila clavipes]